MRETTMQNDYEAPRADLDANGNPEPRSTIVAAVIGGLVVDFLGTMILAVTAGILMLGSAIADPSAAEVLAEPRYAVPLTVIGSAMTLAGGYVAAKWARARSLRSSLAAGTLSLLAGSVFWFEPGAWEPVWLTVPALVLHLPMAALGGRLAQKHAA